MGWQAGLRFDRRLARRPGWLPDQEHEAQLATLPDVSEKVWDPERDGSPGASSSTEPEKGNSDSF